MQKNNNQHRFGDSTQDPFSKQSYAQSRLGASTGGGPRAGRPSPADVIDAEFEDIEVAVKAVPFSLDREPVETRPVAAPAPRFDEISGGGSDRLELFSADKRGKSSVRNGLSAAGFAIVVGAASLCAFWLAGGYALAPKLFEMGSDTGLSLSGVVIDQSREAGGSHFIVEGVIKNDTVADHSVPLLAIAPGSASESQLPLYARAGKRRLAAGESTRFRVRVPNQVRDYGNLTVTLAGGGTGR
ncbi:MAG: hypothetical protein AAF724_16035 [Pseudomonadota bacterium]